MEITELLAVFIYASSIAPNFTPPLVQPTFTIRVLKAMHAKNSVFVKFMYGSSIDLNRPLSYLEIPTRKLG